MFKKDLYYDTFILIIFVITLHEPYNKNNNMH